MSQREHQCRILGATARLPTQESAIALVIRHERLRADDPAEFDVKRGRWPVDIGIEVVRLDRIHAEPPEFVAARIAAAGEFHTGAVDVSGLSVSFLQSLRSHGLRSVGGVVVEDTATRPRRSGGAWHVSRRELIGRLADLAEEGRLVITADDDRLAAALTGDDVEQDAAVLSVALAVWVAAIWVRPQVHQPRAPLGAGIDVRGLHEMSVREVIELTAAADAERRARR